MQNSFGKLLLKSYDEDNFDDNANDNFQNPYNFESKPQPFKSKNIEQVKNEKLQKWNSSDSIHSYTKNTAQSKNIDLDVPNVRQPKNFSNEKVNDNLYETEDYRSSTPNSTIFNPEGMLSPKVSPRIRSKLAPVTKLKLQLAEEGGYAKKNSNNDYSIHSGHSSTEDYFNSFKAPVQQSNPNGGDTETESDGEVVSI